MGWTLSGSGASVVRKSGAAQTITSPLILVSNGTSAEMLKLVGLPTDPVKQDFQVFDGFGNPIASTNNVGGSYNAFGDRFNAFRPGDVFNRAFSVLTSNTDNVAANAQAITIGYGTSLGCVFAIGTGAPGAANPITTGVPANGFYLRTDGGAGTRLYHVEGGVWTATAA